METVLVIAFVVLGLLIVKKEKCKEKELDK